MNLRTATILMLAALAAPCAALAADPPTSRREAAAAWSAEGLRRVQIKGIQVAYARPGAALGHYREVTIAPIRVELSREIDQSLRDPLHLDPQARARIKADVATLVREELAKELGAGGYAVVDAAGPGTLAIDAAVTDVHLTAPDLRIPGRVDVYARSAGAMTFVGTLRDGADGAPLLRVYDPARTFETTFPHHVTVVESDVQFRAAARDWARALRAELDRARGGAR